MSRKKVLAQSTPFLAPNEAVEAPNEAVEAPSRFNPATFAALERDLSVPSFTSSTNIESVRPAGDPPVTTRSPQSGLGTLCNQSSHYTASEIVFASDADLAGRVCSTLLPHAVR